jgi:hypothetical protein
MHKDAFTMTRDCSTARIRKQDLLSLLDTMSNIERQMVTARMPRLRIDELAAVPEPVTVAEGTPFNPLDDDARKTTRFEQSWDDETKEYPAERRQKRQPPVRRMADLTVIGAICTLSLSLCAVLACLP